MSFRVLLTLALLGFSALCPAATPTDTATRSPTPTRSPTSTLSPSNTPTPAPTAACPGGIVAGNSAPLSTSQTGSTGNIFFVPFTAPATGQVSAVHVYVSLAGGGSARGALYDGAVVPGNLLEESVSLGLSDGWNSLGLGGVVNVNGGSRYWVGVMYSSAATAVNRDMTFGGNYFRAIAYGAFPATASATSSGFTWTGFVEICSILSPTESPTVTPTRTVTEALSPTITLTRSLTATLSTSFSPSPSFSVSPTRSETHTRSPTRTPTQTLTPTLAPTASCAGGLTAGNSSILPDTATGSSGNIFFVPFTAPFSGQASAVHVYVNAHGGGSARGAVYDGGAAPGSLLAESASLGLSNGWNSLGLGSAVALTGGLQYWVGVMYSSNSTSINREMVFGNCRFRTIGYGPFPSPAASSPSSYTWTGFVEVCPLQSPTESPTFSHSGTATEVQSPSHSPTATESPSSSPSATASPTATPSASPSPSGTLTLTATASWSPSATPTATPSLTPTPSQTQSFSPSPTFSGSPTRTATPSLTQSPTLSPSFSASPTFSETPTLTETPSLSPSFSASPTSSESLTPSPTPTSSPSATLTLTWTLSGTPSFSPSHTETPTQTPSFTGSPTLSASLTPSASFTQSPSLTVTPTGSRVIVFGNPQLVSMHPIPNPGPLALAILSEGRAPVRVRIFSVGLAKVHSFEAQVDLGWNLLAIPEAVRLELASGLYYASATALSWDKPTGRRVEAKLYILK